MVKVTSYRLRALLALAAVKRWPIRYQLLGLVLVVAAPKTIETYRLRLMKKLRVNNVADLVKFAIAHGLTPPS